MSEFKNKSRLVRILSAAAIGIAFALVDGGLHGDPAEWQNDPASALIGAANLGAFYALVAGFVGAVLPWRLFVYAAPGTFAALQALLAYSRANPGLEAGGLMLAGVVALVSGCVAAAVSAFAFGTDRPRPAIVGPAAACVGMVLLLSLLGNEPRVADGHPSPPAAARRTGAGAAFGAKPTGPNVLLITLDTLRADRLGVHGYRGMLTPGIDTIGNDGAVMLSAVTQAPTTPPSHASILTGLYPSRHGIRGFESGLSLPADHPTLAEVLGAEGYATGAVIASVPLRPGSGIERGYDEYSFEMPPTDYAYYGFRDTIAARLLKRLQIVTDRTGYRPGRIQTDLAIDWVARHSDRPWFLWVHYFDVHDPYAPPKKHLLTGRHPGAKVADFLKRSYLYDSELSYLDEQIGRLLAYLDDAALLDDTVVAGISDHGEALGEHNYVGHSYKLYQEQVHGVFLMRYPGAIPAGTRIEAQVRSIDYYPTVLDLLGLPVPHGVQGRSLLPLVRAGGRGEDRLAVTETVSSEGNRMIAVVDGRYKLIAEPGAGVGGSVREELYDLDADPLELDNLIASNAHTDTVGELRSAVGAYIAETIESQTEPTRMEDDVRGRLRALGYLD